MVIIEFCLTLGKFPFRYSLEPKETYSNLDKFGQKLLSGNTTANLESKQSWRYYQMKFSLKSRWERFRDTYVLKTAK